MCATAGDEPADHVSGGGQVLVPGGHQAEHLRSFQVVSEILEDRNRVGVSPVQVL